MPGRLSRSFKTTALNREASLHQRGASSSFCRGLIAVWCSGRTASPSLRDEILHPAVHIGPFGAELFSLLFGVVARTHERSALADFESPLERRIPKPGELVGVHPAIDRKVVASRLKVLADGEDVTITPGADVIKKFENLMLMFTDTEHDASLGDEPVGLELLEHLETSVVTGLRSDGRVHPLHRLHVVADDLGPSITDKLDVPLDALEVTDQNFHAGLGACLVDRLDRLGPDSGAAVGLVIPVDTGDHHMLQFDLSERIGDPTRLVVVDWHRLPGLHVAESATPGAGVTQNHDRRGAAIPALPHVRATRLLADGVEAVLVDKRLQLEISLTTWNLCSKPVWLAADPHLLGRGLVVQDHPGEGEARRAQG